MRGLPPVILAAVGSALVGGDAKGGAWTLEQGGAQVFLTARVKAGEAAVESDGDAAWAPSYDELGVDALIEYGVTDRFTLLAYGGAKDTDHPWQGSAANLDSTGLAGRLGVFRDDDWAVSVQLGGGVDNFAGAGHSRPEAEGRFLVGRSFDLARLPAFAEIQTGYRLRGSDAADEVLIDVTLGARPRPDVLLLAQAFNALPTGDGMLAFTDDREHKAQLSVVWDVTARWSIQLGAFSTVGQEAWRERGAVVAIWRRF